MPEIVANDRRVVMHDYPSQYVTTLAVVAGYWPVRAATLLDSPSQMRSLEWILRCFGNERKMTSTPAPHKCYKCGMFKDKTKKLGSHHLCIPCFEEVVSAWQSTRVSVKAEG